MSYPNGIRAWEIEKFTNLHENFTQHLDKNQSYDPYINDESWLELDQFEQYKRCTENLQWIIRESMSKQMNVRAMGSGWSFSKVAVCDDTIINTKRLRHKFNLGESNFLPEFLARGSKAENYRFLQCGNTVISINEFLEKKSNPPKCIKASGGSNGQTIVGAFSTGTHGGALFYGAISETIRGLHIITGSDRHVYIERASNQITSGFFHEKLGAEVIIDDDLFNAALVSFGSFGIIHGVLIEVEDRFLLEQKRTRIPFDGNFEQAITSGQFHLMNELLKYPIEDQAHPLYHLELAINPHDFEYNNPEKGVYFRTIYKVPYREEYNKFEPEEGYTYGKSTSGLIQSVLDTIQKTAGFLNRALIPTIVNTLFDAVYNKPSEEEGTMGEMFRNTELRGNLFSVAFGLDRADLKKVIDLCLEINKKCKLAGIMAFRFVKGTEAMLGFTKWENSCVLELDGIDSKINYKFVNKLVEKLEAETIPYSLHWGKINRVLNKQRVENIYGKEVVENWKRQRSRVMSEDVQEAFNNEFMERCGLDDFIPYECGEEIA